MKFNKLLITFFLLSIISISYAQKEKPNSETRQFIDNADITQINKDWNVKAEFRSGLGEVVLSFQLKQLI